MSSGSQTHAPRHDGVQARPVSKRGDRHEREAEQAADVVARGGSVAGWSFSAVPTTAPAPAQRQEGVAKSDEEKKKELVEKTDEQKKEEAKKKTAEAVLKTPQVEALKEKVLNDPVVKTVKDAVTSTPGLIATGAAAAGGVAALAATGKELPMQPPEIPLDKIKPGMSAKVTYEGPVNAPTFVGLSVSFKEQGPKGKGAKKADPIAADIARLKAQQEIFKPVGQKAAERQQEQEMVNAWIASQQGFTIPLPTPPAEKKEEVAPAQPAPASPAAEPPAHAAVDGAFSTPGRPLDPSTRRSMETRFGYDFSRVRVHDDARAAATAGAIDAAAFTVGEDIAFAAGRYDATGEAGRRLLAHELAHVAQQGAGRLERRGAPVVAADHAEEHLEAEKEGRPLPPPVRTGLELRFGRRLDDVRVHTGPEGRRVAGDHSAVAVAKGSEIFFSSGAWAPGTEAGDRILRHEIAHLLQGRAAPAGMPWPVAILEAEADLAATAPAGVALLGRAAYGEPLLMKTYVSTISEQGYLEQAVRFYALWEGERATRVGSYQAVVEDLAKGKAPLSEFRIVAHGSADELFLPLLSKAKEYASESALELQTQQQLAGALGEKTHLSADETDTAFGFLSKDAAAKPLLTRLGLTAAPTGMLKEFVWWVVDEHLANAPEDPSGTGTFTTKKERQSLQANVRAAQAVTRSLAAAELPSDATKADLDELRVRTLGAFTADGWTWELAPGALKEKLARFDDPFAAALVREVKAGTFEQRLKAAKSRVSDKTHIEIRGCNVGKNDDYLEGIRAFFGTAPDALPSISAPMLYQFYGSPGLQVLPPGAKAPPLEDSLEFLFEETLGSTDAAAALAAVKTAKLEGVADLAKVLQFADVKTEFERWFQMKAVAGGATTPVTSATLQDFKDFLTTAPPRTFPLNAPGYGAESTFFLILIPATAIEALVGWVKDQGYTLPGGKDLTKHFFKGSTKFSEKGLAGGASRIIVDWLGDDYPVPNNIFFPEDPEYKNNIRRLPAAASPSTTTPSSTGTPP
jgi:hypothetical protein